MPHLPWTGCAVPGFLLALFLAGCATQPDVVRTVIEVPLPELYTMEPPNSSTQYRFMSVVMHDVVTYRVGKERLTATNDHRTGFIKIRTFQRKAGAKLGDTNYWEEAK